MSNMAVGMTLGMSMNSFSGMGSSGSPDMPAWVALICAITLALCIIATVVNLYRKDSDLLKSHWERLIIGPAMGMCIWFCIAMVVALFVWLFSYII